MTLYSKLRRDVRDLRYEAQQADRECADICGDLRSTEAARGKAIERRTEACTTYHIWRDLLEEKGS